MIEFDALAMKANTDELHTIFLLKKNIQQDIIKTILRYPPITIPESLKKWKVAITSVRQGYESIKGCHNYKMEFRSNKWGMRTTNGHWKIQQQL